MMWLVLVTGGVYIVVIASFFYGWKKLDCLAPQQISRFPYVSVVVPMRNEENHILHLVQDLDKQDYPKNLFEVIIADDHSTDQSVQIVNTYRSSNMRIIVLSEHIAGKKAAIHQGVNASSGEIIITTDADCRVGTQWISSLVSCFEKYGSVLVLAPVIAFPPRTMMQKMLSLEMYSLLGSTAGSAAIGHAVMCNGANLAFRKEVYPEIEHLHQNAKIKSGDDIFTMLELKKKHSESIHFLKNTQASVFTDVPSTLTSFFKQRGRWVSKAKYYRDPAIILTATVVLCINILLAICLVYGLLCHNFSAFFILLLLKSIIDVPFLYQVTAFFRQKQLMLWFPLVQCFYFLYVCISVLTALVAPVSWKGRKLS